MAQIIKGLYLCSWSDAQDLAPTFDNLLINFNLTKNTYRLAINDVKHEEIEEIEVKFI